MIIPYVGNINTLNILIDHVFPNINKYTNNLDFMTKWAILTLRNDYADDINNLLIYQFPWNIIRYYNFNECLDTTKHSVHEDFFK